METYTNYSESVESDLQVLSSTSGESYYYNSSNNSRLAPEMPIEMKFNESHLIAIVGYSLLFILSAMGKFGTVFIYHFTSIA